MCLVRFLCAASPRNDGATIGRLGLAGAFDCCFVVGGVAFEAVRLYGRAGEHSHCEVVGARLSCTSNLNRSNLLEKGNLAKKGLGNGEIVLSRIVLAG